MLSSCRHGGHHGPRVLARVVALNRVERTLPVRAADGVEVAVEDGHGDTQPPRHHGGHLRPLVLFGVVPLDMVEARNAVLEPKNDRDW